jgi:hypothetical protein
MEWTNDSVDAAIDVDLWGMVLPAVVAAGDAADAHLSSGGWRPRVPLPTVGTFDCGWPNLQRDRLFPPDDAPTDFARLFAAARGSLAPLEYADVPELAALIDFVRNRKDLRARVMVPTATNNVELEDRMLQYEAADLALSILNRGRALGAQSEGELLRIYLQRERSWLLDPLPVEYLVPLALTALDLDTTLVIDATTLIEPMDPATQAARSPSSSSMGAVPDTVVSAATHAVVFAERVIPNPGPGPRIFGPQPEEALPLDEADLVCTALRVLSHTAVGYAQVVRRPVGWADGWAHDLPPLTPVTTVRRYPEGFDNYGWLHMPPSVPRRTLDRLPATTEALRTAPSNVALAARRLSTAVLRTNDDDTTIDACIGLEALLGDGRDELTRRLAQRAAAVLATRPQHPADPEATYELVKKIYAHRSAVVHGTPGDRTRTLTLGDDRYATGAVAVIILREVLADALTRTPRWSTRSLDQLILAALRDASNEGP